MKKIVWILTAFLALFACTKEADITGSVTGQIVPYEYYDFNEDDIPGVKIAIDGQNIHKETLSDNDGFFVFDGLKPGYYDFTFTKEGFDTTRYLNFAFIGLGQQAILDRRIYLSKHKKYELKELNLNMISVDGATLIEGFALLKDMKDGLYPGLSIYLDKESDVSYQKYTFSFRGIQTFTFYDKDTLFIKDYLMTETGVGEKWYVAAYVYGYGQEWDISQSNGGYFTLEEKGIETQELTVR